MAADFITKRFIVKCKTGIFAESTTGRRLVRIDEKNKIEKDLTNKYSNNTDKDDDIEVDGNIDIDALFAQLECLKKEIYERNVENDPVQSAAIKDEEGVEYEYSDYPSRYVKKNLQQHLITASVETSDSGIEITIYQAKKIARHGIIWEQKAIACFNSNDLSVSFNGEGTVKDWFFNDCIDYSLNTRNEFVFFKIFSMYSKWWHSVHPSYILKHISSFNELIRKWADGSLKSIIEKYDPIKNMRFGIELEFTGMTRVKAASILKAYFNTQGLMNSVMDKNGRVWKIVYDSSISAITPADCDDYRDYKCELVTPLLTFDDIPLLQELVRKLRINGMRVNYSCGIHVHVDSSLHTAKSLVNLINIFASKESLIFEALDVDTHRIRYCEHTAPQLLNNMNRSAEIKNMNDVKKHWYDSYVDPSEKVSGHYHDSRYHALNLHSMWQGKGIEFRMFNSTTHEGKVKAYIQFCLALNNYAIQRERRSVRMASFHEHPHQNEAQYFEYWLKKIGLVGDEYKTARLHLLKIFKEKEKTNNSVRRLSA